MAICPLFVIATHKGAAYTTRNTLISEERAVVICDSNWHPSFKFTPVSAQRLFKILRFWCSTHFAETEIFALKLPVLAVLCFL